MKRKRLSDSQVVEEATCDDYRCLNIIPNPGDLVTSGNDPSKSKNVEGIYRDAAHYLVTHFRLLREEFFGLVRSSLNEYRQKKDRRRLHNYGKLQLYYNVQIDRDSSMKGANLFQITFDLDGLEGHNWKTSHLLNPGSVLFISSDHFNTFSVFTIHHRDDPKPAKRGVIVAKLIGPLLAFSRNTISSSMAELNLSDMKYNHVDVLRALQEMNEDSFPLIDSLLGRSINSEHPIFLTNSVITFILYVLMARFFNIFLS